MVPKIHILPLFILLILISTVSSSDTRLLYLTLQPETYKTWYFQSGELLVENNLLRGSQFNLITPVSQVDLNANSVPETVIVQGEKTSITENGLIVWQSPSDWKIKHAQVTDLNHDQAPEVTLLLWRTYRPWPIDIFLIHPGKIQGYQDREGNSCHIILIGWKRDMYREVWAGSPMQYPLLSIVVADVDDDQQEELVSLETRYDRIEQTPAISLSVWEWNGFGFSLLARQDGLFSELQIARINDRMIILTW